MKWVRVRKGRELPGDEVSVTQGKIVGEGKEGRGEDLKEKGT